MYHISKKSKLSKTLDESQQILPEALILLLVLILTMTYMSNVSAQTELQIPTNNFDLEQEYDAELDKSLLKAYEGDADAQFKTGVLFASDQFNKADLKHAVYWHEKAAQQGHALAQYNLGHYYLAGKGITKNEPKAIEWWQKAAEQDHPIAQFNVGRAFYLGIGVSQNIEQAQYWLQRAARNKEPNSIEILKELGWSDLPLVDRPAPSQIIASAKPVAPATPSVVVPVVPTVAPTVAPTEVPPVVNSNVTLFTNPAVKSVAIVSSINSNDLSVVSENDDWIKVTKNDGFPIWVHSDFLNLSDDNTATLTGDSVNARSAPEIVSGTIVDRLKEGERLQVIKQQGAWYQLQSPTRFAAWVKASEYNN